MRRAMALTFIAISLTACSNQGLVQLQSTSRGPDEFMVEPKKELVIPGNLAELPQPTPGQGNRTDIDPVSDAAVALGGRQQDPNAAVPASDGALVSAASRFGVESNIRGELAAEDAEFRRKKSRFTNIRLFPENLYNDVYRSQALDPAETADAWRRAGAQTPSYPPQ